MASLLRTAARQGCRILTSNAAIRQRTVQPACLISTSKKNKDAATINETIQTKPEAQTGEDDPVSYQHHEHDDDNKVIHHNMTAFRALAGLASQKKLTCSLLQYKPAP